MALSDSQCRRYFWYLIGAAAALLLIRLGAADIYILDEAKNAQCAREMWHRGDWVLPTFNGELRTDKPALHYWCMMLSYQMFGYGYWQARLFSALMGLGTLAVVFWGTRRLWNGTVALASTLALVLSPHFLFEFRLSVPDPYLIFFTTCGLFCGLLYLQKPSWKWALLTGISLALATLAKGPVALALPGLCFVVYLLLQKKWAVLRDGKWLAAILLYLAIAAPWYWLVHLRSEGAFTQGFFFDHNLNRFSSEKEGHGANFFIVPLIVLVGMLPFSVLAFSRLKKQYGLWQQPLFVFSMVVSLVYIVFFGFSSTKLPNYPMPAYPFVAVVCGAALASFWQTGRAIPRFALIIWIIIGLGLAFGGFFGIRAEAAVAPQASLTFGLGIVALCSILAWLWRSNSPILRPWLLASLGWCLMAAYAFWLAYPRLYNQNPATVAYQQMISSQTRLLAYRAFNPAFLVQHPISGTTIPMVNTTEELQHLVQTAASDSGYSDILIISREEFVTDLPADLFSVVFTAKDLFELPTTVLLKPVRPIKK